MIDIRVYKYDGHIKRTLCKDSRGFVEVSVGEIFEIIRDSPDEDFNFVDINNDRADMNSERILTMLKWVEKHSKNQTMDLTKIIRCGGFIPYIRKLEQGMSDDENTVKNL